MNIIRLYYHKWFGRCKKDMPLSEQLEVARSKKKGLKFECVRKDKCPDCKTTGKMQIGSSGGMCTNVRCGKCGSRFNITPFGVDRI